MFLVDAGDISRHRVAQQSLELGVGRYRGDLTGDAEQVEAPV